MGHHLLIRAGAVLTAAFILAACTDDEPATESANTGDSQAQTSQPAQQEQVQTQQPSGPAPGTQEHFVLNVGDRVFFDTDKYDLDANDRDILRRQAAYLSENPGISITIEGHADERGTREYNLGLGDRRATSVKDYLLSLGVRSSRVRTISYGKERPVALGHNESAWSQNRRSVTVIGN